MKKRNRVLICLAAGVLVLAVSATAAFGSVNGYAAYKKAILDLALEEENFSAKGSMYAKLDETQMLNAGITYTQDGHDHSAVIGGYEGSVKDTRHQAIIDGVETRFDESWDYYYQTEGVTTYDNLLGFNGEDEMETRLVNFVEIAADTVMGELKNNFVQIGSEDGKDLYQVNISQSQVPSLVNAGLSLMAYTAANGNGDYSQVRFEDLTESMFTYYEKTTGETLSPEFKGSYKNGYDSEWYEENQAMVDKFEETTAGVLSDQFYGILEEKGNQGVVYVHTDNTYDYYPDPQAFVADHPDELYASLDYYVAKDMVLENVACTFSLDDQGRVADTQITVTFTTTDADGGHHTLEVGGQVDVYDYGTTVVQPLNVGDRVEATD